MKKGVALLLMTLCFSIQARELVIKEPSEPYQFMPYGVDVDGDKRKLVIARVIPVGEIVEVVALELYCTNRGKNTNPKVTDYARSRGHSNNLEYAWSTKMHSDITNIILGSKFNKYVYQGCNKTETFEQEKARKDREWKKEREEMEKEMNPDFSKRQSDSNQTQNNANQEDIGKQLGTAIGKAIGNALFGNARR